MNDDFWILDQISSIARVAGKEIMKVYYGNKDHIRISQKMDRSPVTTADLFSNKIIVHLLQDLTPNVPVISEEQLPDWKECKQWDYFWLIDPLDGTKEFISRNGEFTVNIAFIKYGEPIIGVIYVPAYDILYAANKNQAWKVDSSGTWSQISAQISSNPTIVISRTHSTIYDQILLSHYLINIENYRIVYIGSSFKFCLIAEGIAQFYPRFSSTKIWDTAAGHAIVLAAGAMVNDWQGQPLNYKNINKYFLNPGFQVSLY